MRHDSKLVAAVEIVAEWADVSLPFPLKESASRGATYRLISACLAVANTAKSYGAQISQVVHHRICFASCIYSTCNESSHVAEKYTGETAVEEKQRPVSLWCPLPHLSNTDIAFDTATTLAFLDLMALTCMFTPICTIYR